MFSSPRSLSIHSFLCFHAFLLCLTSSIYQRIRSSLANVLLYFNISQIKGASDIPTGLTVLSILISSSFSPSNYFFFTVICHHAWTVQSMQNYISTLHLLLLPELLRERSLSSCLPFLHLHFLLNYKYKLSNSNLVNTLLSFRAVLIILASGSSTSATIHSFLCPTTPRLLIPFFILLFHPSQLMLNSVNELL